MSDSLARITAGQRLWLRSARRPRRRTVERSGLYLVVLAGAFLMALPFLWTVSVSVRPPGGSESIPIQWLPSQVTWNEYHTVLSQYDLGRFTLNSLLVASLAALGTMVASSLLGYAWAVFAFPGRRLLFSLLLLLMALPGQVMIIPVYLIWSKLSAIDTYVPLTVPFLLGTASAFGVFLVRQYFLTIPRDFRDVAELDGAGPLAIYLRIYVPLGLPAIVTAGLLAFITSWNEVFVPLLYLNTQSKWTVQLGLLQMLRGQFGTAPPELLAAGSVISMIPILIIFVVAQRWLVNGFVGTGLKG
jgi:multiple sugar transport system permease protein